MLHQTLGEGGESGNEEADLEEGVLYQPLVEGSRTGGRGVVVGCVERSKADGSPCTRYVGIFGEAWHFVKHTAKSAWHKFGNVAHYIINARSKATNGTEPYKGGQVASGCEVTGFLTTFGSPFVKIGSKLAFTVGATIWASC